MLCGIYTASQLYKYNGKELDQMHKLNLYDYSARYYESAIGRFTSVDPLAEKYYSISPYTYVGNNPIIRTDPTGMDWYVFDEEDSEYKEKQEAKGTHRMAVRSVDKKGNITYKFQDFNDPDVDAKAIENGTINKMEFMSETKVEELIDASGVKSSNAQRSPWSYAYNEGARKMDYGHRGVASGHLNKNTFYIREGTAYNLGDIGNYLWGRGMAELGFELGTARFGAHANNFLFGRRQGTSYYDFGLGTYGAYSVWDSPGDQRAIINGYSNSPAGKNMIKKTKNMNQQIMKRYQKDSRLNIWIH